MKNSAQPYGKLDPHIYAIRRVWFGETRAQAISKAGSRASGTSLHSGGYALEKKSKTCASALLAERRKAREIGEERIAQLTRARSEAGSAMDEFYS